MQRILEGAFNNPKNGHQQKLQTPILLPAEVGKKLNLAWTLFFLVLGTVNLYVAYQFSDSVWVNFKLYGITLTTLIFSILQTICLMRYLKF